MGNLTQNFTSVQQNSYGSTYVKLTWLFKEKRKFNRTKTIIQFYIAPYPASRESLVSHVNDATVPSAAREKHLSRSHFLFFFP